MVLLSGNGLFECGIKVIAAGKEKEQSEIISLQGNIYKAEFIFPEHFLHYYDDAQNRGHCKEAETML